MLRRGRLRHPEASLAATKTVIAVPENGGRRGREGGREEGREGGKNARRQWSVTAVLDTPTPDGVFFVEW